MKTKFITQSAIIAAIYIAVTALFAPISFGHNFFQLRVSEALTVLPLFTPAAIPGLFIGCAVSNIAFGGLGIIDLIFGSLSTLIASFLSYLLRKKSPLIALMPPVLVNALIVGLYLNYLISPEINPLINIGWVFIGQLLSCYGLGLPLCKAIKKYGKDFFDNNRK